jgi:hypothetical protein
MAATDGRGSVPNWVRALICVVGFVLMAIGVGSFLLDHSDGALGMLIVGAFLFVGGPLMNRLTSFKFGLTGAEATLAEALAAAEDQMAEGDVVVAPEPATAIATGHPPTITTAEQTGEGTLSGEVANVVTPVVLTEGASKVIDQLSDQDRDAVWSVVHEMMVSPEGPGGVLLPGSGRYLARPVNDHIRLVFRAVDRLSEDDPPGYTILNVVRPGSTLWKITGYALD